MQETMVGVAYEKITDVERLNMRQRIAGRAASVHGVVGEKQKVHVVMPGRKPEDLSSRKRETAPNYVKDPQQPLNSVESELLKFKNKQIIESATRPAESTVQLESIAENSPGSLGPSTATIHSPLKPIVTQTLMQRVAFDHL